MQSLLKKPLAVNAAEQKPKESQAAAPMETNWGYSGLARCVTIAPPRHYADQADICPICFDPACTWRPSGG